MQSLIQINAANKKYANSREFFEGSGKPSMSGDEFAENLRAAGRASGLPVFVSGPKTIRVQGREVMV